MANTPDLLITPFGGDNLETAELRMQNLYLHHLYGGASPNQEDIITRDDAGKHGFGSTVVHNWTIYDADTAERTLVARAQGLHILAGTWHHSFTVVFEAGRLKGSTLEVMGASVEEHSPWAIVGGTGDLSMARGVIKRRLHRKIDGGLILQLTIHAFCAPESFPAFDTSSVLWGGIKYGSVVKNIVKPWRLESVTIKAEGIVDSIQFSYIDQDGVRRTETRLGEGGGDGSTNTINLAPKEYVKELSGSYTMWADFSQIVLTSLKLVTNFNTYGPFGKGAGTPFKADIPENSIVVGFHGRAARFVNAIGVYTMKTN
ncbi:hypothetical protein TRIUR3_06346 [Triticum urartu]|uniref:Dirigent protein n=2 Tax=Triticum urartu TaxID=4572 RepID=M8AWZ3_TRIUA|nr:mannose/glucose-specific lectin-like [Triticum urartu]EMS65594.1 hypothetical protein TRIUR3_06346 [Triticum urartu]